MAEASPLLQRPLELPGDPPPGPRGTGPDARGWPGRVPPQIGRPARDPGGVAKPRRAQLGLRRRMGGARDVNWPTPPPRRPGQMTGPADQFVVLTGGHLQHRRTDGFPEDWTRSRAGRWVRSVGVTTHGPANKSARAASKSGLFGPGRRMTADEATRSIQQGGSRSATTGPSHCPRRSRWSHGPAGNHRPRHGRPSVPIGVHRTTDPPRPPRRTGLDVASSTTPDATTAGTTSSRRTNPCTRSARPRFRRASPRGTAQNRPRPG